MKKHTFLKVLGGVLLFAALFLLVQPFSVPVIDPETYIVNGFYALPKNSIQIAGIGSSEMMSGMKPAKLQEEYGWAAYDLAVATADIPVEYLYLTEVFQTQSPRLVVLEVGPSELEFSIDDPETLLYACSPVKNSGRKMELFYALSGGDVFKTLSYTAFPLLGYHASWDMFTPGQITNPLRPTCNTEGGYYRRDSADPSVTLAYRPAEGAQPLRMSAQSEEYLHKIADLCAQQGAKLLLLKIPAADWTYERSLGMQQLADENGWNYLDCSAYLAEMGIDPAADFYDGPHMNDTGAEKLTAFVGQYIQAHYGTILNG